MKAQLQEMMMNAYPLLVQAAYTNYGDTSRKGVLRLRDEYRTNHSLQLEPAQEQALRSLTIEEDRILSTWIGIGLSLARAFYYTFGKGLRVDYSEFKQAAYQAVYDSMYLYSGAQEFSTFIHWATKNKLKDLVRYAKRQKRDPQRIVWHDLHSVADEQEEEDFKLLKLQSIMQANLTDFQREVIAKYVECNENAAEVARQQPSGHPCTRSAVADTLRRARKQIREKYQELIA
jgi:RNA polymerase sigma factor (sigma-70 family)